MPIRGSPNGANALVDAIHTPDVIGGMGGRHQSERVDVTERPKQSEALSKTPSFGGSLRWAKALPREPVKVSNMICGEKSTHLSCSSF
jgi:hypothetical protein